jgi:large subunit ribosomal protein L10
MRQEKQFLLDELQEKFEKHGSFVIASYENLKASVATDFRNTVAKTGGDFEVVRKRVFQKAAEDKGYQLDPKFLQGHVGVVFTGEDTIETLKAVIDFGKNNPNTLSVTGGQFDGTIYDAQQVAKLSKLPGKDQMRSELLGLFEAPMAQTLSVMEALLTSVMHCLENKIQAENGNQ